MSFPPPISLSSFFYFHLCHFFYCFLSLLINIAEPQPTNFTPTFKMKTDPGAAELLFQAYKAYTSFKANNEYKIIVRPYIFGDYARKLDINTITQFAFYKCMHGACLFACNTEENWKIHMEQHSNLIDLLGEQVKKNSNDKNELLKFCECPYCGYEPKRNKNIECRSLDAICRHMEMEHLRNTIQCAHCYYRTNEMDNIVLHMEKYHPNCDREILLHGMRREFQDSDLEELKQCDRNVTRIKCDLCKYFFGDLNFQLKISKYPNFRCQFQNYFIFVLPFNSEQ